MRLDEQILKKSIVDYNKLIPYGFIKKDDYYIYQKFFKNNTFLLDFKVFPNGLIKSKVIDIAFNEEFTLINVKNVEKGFINEIRNEYIQILEDLRNHCFIKLFFISNQANRLALKIHEKYQEEPVFPFSSLDDCGVFKYSLNNKWYALITNIKKHQLLKNQDEELIDVLNVKIDPSSLNHLLKIKGIYKAYHMNKKHWISILLDDNLDDDFIMQLIDESRNRIIK